MRRVLFLIFFIALLSGCGAVPAASVARASVADGLQAATVESATAMPVPTAATITSTVGSNAVAGEVFIRYQRSGGLTGATASYSIHADGSVTLESSRLVRGGGEVLAPAPDPQTAADLLSRISATGITSVAPGDYSPESTCCDRAAYLVTVYLGGQEYTYTTVDGAQNLPPQLGEVIEIVRSYLDSVQ